MRDDLENRMDNYFREGLDNLNVIPPVEVWNNIAEQLPVKKNKSRLVIWIAVAASVSLFAAISGWNYLNRSEKSIVLENTTEFAQTKDTDNTSKPETSKVNENGTGKIASSSTAELNLKSEVISPDSNHKEQNLISASDNSFAIASDLQEHTPEKKGISDNSTSFPNGSDVIVSSTSKSNLLIADNSNNVSLAAIELKTFETPGIYGKIEQGIVKIKIDTAPAYDNIFAYDETLESKEKLNRWAIGGQMAPLYSYRSISEVNAPGISKASMNKVENAVITYASGVKVDYEATSRLTFQTGVYYMKMGQEINNVSSLKSAKLSNGNAFMDMQSSKAAEGFTASNSTGVIIAPSAEIYPQSSLTVDHAEYTVGNLAARPADLSQKDIEQSFDFIEVPFLAKYKIIDRKINLHLLGGMSTHVLVGNKTTLRTGNDEVIHGKTADVQTMNYSSSVGFGVVYYLRKNLMFSVEPTFKYYLNSFNSSDAVKLHPYALGLYSGFSFKF